MTSYHPTNEDLPNGRTADTSKGVVADLATAVGAQLPSASVPISFPAKVDVLCQWFAQVLRDRDAKDPVALVYAKAVAGVLCWLHANRERGRCDPSLETIAKEAGIGKQSAKDATDLLEARGHVRIIRGGDRRSSKYVLLMQRGNGLHSEDRSSVALTSTERSRKRRAMQRERSSCNGETVFVQRGNGLHSGDSNPKTLNPKNLEPEEARTSSALLAGQENEGKGKSKTESHIPAESQKGWPTKKEESAPTLSAATWDRINAEIDRVVEAYDGWLEKNDGEFPITSADHCARLVRELFLNVHNSAPEIQTTVDPAGLHLIKEWDGQGLDLGLCFAWILDKLIERVRAGSNIQSLAYFDKAIQQGVAETEHSR